jgi:hypothetical protein
MRPFRLMRLVRRNLAAHRRSNLLSRSRGISMSSAPGSWPPPGLQGVNVQGALKVHRRFADGTEAGQKARSVERPTCAVLLRVIQRRAVLISASVYPSRPRSVVDSSPWAHSLLAGNPDETAPWGGRLGEAASSKARTSYAWKPLQHK